MASQLGGWPLAMHHRWERIRKSTAIVLVCHKPPLHTSINHRVDPFRNLHSILLLLLLPKQRACSYLASCISSTAPGTSIEHSVFLFPVIMLGVLCKERHPIHTPSNTQPRVSQPPHPLTTKQLWYLVRCQHHSPSCLVAASATSIASGLRDHPL